jgi:hypothetical protein
MIVQAPYTMGSSGLQGVCEDKFADKLDVAIDMISFSSLGVLDHCTHGCTTPITIARSSPGAKALILDRQARNARKLSSCPVP